MLMPSTQKIPPDLTILRDFPFTGCQFRELPLRHHALVLHCVLLAEVLRDVPVAVAHLLLNLKLLLHGVAVVAARYCVVPGVGVDELILDLGLVDGREAVLRVRDAGLGGLQEELDGALKILLAAAARKSVEAQDIGSLRRSGVVG